jgi:hypothetical protein
MLTVDFGWRGRKPSAPGRSRAAGALLTYAWAGFALTALFEPNDPVRWYGNAGFAAGAVALALMCAFSRRART